tara:strand:+ start:1032 stop:3551 length:2520 start_codon:yes stop_codon:yes gene_type:complete
MTVSSSTTKVSLSANGTQHSFAYTFKIFAAADLEVIVRTSAGTETVQTNNTNYIVTGAGNANGGNVLFKFNTGDASNAHHDASTDHRPANGTTVIIRRKLTLTQGTDYVENDPFPAAAHEDALDRLTMVTQQIQEELDRSIKASTGNTFSGSTFTLSATDRANKIFAFDSSGNLAVTQELGTFRGNFAASTAYAVRDLIKDTSTNNIFIVNTAHTSSGSQPLTTNANSAKYTLLVDASSATTSQNAAAASATASANSATAAASSASTATTKASEASTSASNAATSLATFQGQYHGAAGSDPSSNLDTGDLYFNTSSGMKVYNGSAFEDIKPTSSEQTNINTVAGISSAVTTVSNANSNITALNATGVITNIGTVAGISSDVTTVAGLNATHLANVSGQATNIGNLGPISANITSVANIASDVTSLANSLEKTYTVTVANVGGNNVFVLDGSNYPAIEMFRGNTYIFNQTDATNDGHPLVFKNGSSAYEVGVTYFLNGSAATQSNYVNVTTFNAGRSSGNRQVQIEVASNAPSTGLRYYCYVHGNGMGNTITVKDSNVSLVAGSIANVNLTGGSIASVNTTAGSIANVNAVATNIANVNSFAARYRVGSTNPTSDNDAGDLFFNTTSNELVAFNGSTFQATSPSAANQNNINIVAGQITAQEDLGSIANAVSTSSGNDINTVANAISNVTALGTTANIANMATLTASGVVANIASVAGSISNVNTAASNLSGINSFAERYRVASSAPTSSLDAGDLYFNTSTNTLNYYNGSAFVAVVAGAMTSLAVDSTPQLGGNLDVNGNSIVSASNGDITIAPNGSGEINLNGTVNTDNLTIDFGSIA